MFTPPRKPFGYTLVLVLSCLLTASAAFAADAVVESQGSQQSLQQQMIKMRRSLALMRRSLAASRAQSETVSKGISDVKNSLSTITQRVITGTSVSTQSVIGLNKPASNYLTFDFYPGVRGEAIVQHKDTGIMVWFRTAEGSKTLNEYKLGFSFEGRSADQKTADAMMLNACLTHFNRVSDAPNGGSFYLYPSADNNTGLLCSSTINS